MITGIPAKGFRALTVAAFMGTSYLCSLIWTPEHASPEDRQVQVSYLTELLQTTLQEKQRGFDAARIREDLGLKIGDYDLAEYQSLLEDTWNEYFSIPGDTSKYSTVPLRALNSRLSLSSAPPANISLPRSVYTTSVRPEFPDQFQNWVTENPTWKVSFFDDEKILGWMKSRFVAKGKEGGRAKVLDEFEAFEHGVFKSDFFRYLILLMRGGVYTDTDTSSVKPLDNWPGLFSSYPHTINLGSDMLTKLPKFIHNTASKSSQAKAKGDDGLKEVVEDEEPPALVVAIEYDHAADKNGGNWRKVGMSRGMQIVQWTLAAKPFHPVFLDVIGQILRDPENVRKKRSVGEEADEEEIIQQISNAEVLDLTGPGAFSDAVFRYLLARYGVTPNEISNFKQPIRVGDVLIYPVHSFRTDASEPERNRDDPMKLVWHGFFGSWKPKEDEKR